MGLLTCYYCTACSAGEPLVLKDCLFVLGFGMFSTFSCVLALWCWGKKKEKANSFIWQFETQFSGRYSQLKDFCLMHSPHTAFPPLPGAGWFSLPFSSSISTAVEIKSILGLDRNSTR